MSFVMVHLFNYSGLLARFISKIGSKDVFLRRFYKRKKSTDFLQLTCLSGSLRVCIAYGDTAIQFGKE